MNISMDLDRLSELSKLSLTEEEREILTEELHGMLVMMERIREADTDGIPAAEHFLPLTNVLREDVPEPCMDREDLLAAADSTADGYITVPRAVEE